MKSDALRKMVRGAAVAAAYAILTVIWPFSIGPLQCRVSEALCVLPFLFSEAVPGLFIGCLLGNLIEGAVPLDIVFGSLATLLAAFVTYYMGKKKWPPFLAPLPAVLFNAAVIGLLLSTAYEYGLSFPVAALQVGGGEAISCYVLGLPLLYALNKRRGTIK